MSLFPRSMCNALTQEKNAEIFKAGKEELQTVFDETKAVLGIGNDLRLDQVKPYFSAAGDKLDRRAIDLR